jgi:hypothetical protein
MVSVLPQYTEELLHAGREEHARILLEFAVSCQADSSKIYTQLASVYATHGETDRIAWLKEQAKALPDITARRIEKELTAMF